MGYTPKNLGHVNMYVRNAEKSRQWYEDLLGLHTYTIKPGWAAFMSADLDQSHEIALVEVGDDAEGPRKGQVGLNHMAWRMETLDDLKELYHRIKEKNVPIKQVSDHGISLGIYIADPDGNGIQVYYELPRNEWDTQEDIFGAETMAQGRFPGPWDQLMAEQEEKATARQYFPAPLLANSRLDYTFAI